MSLTGKELMARAALKTAPVELEAGGTVIIRAFSVGDRGEFMHRTRTNPGTLAAWIVAQCCIDENGARLYCDEDEGTLAQLDPQVLDPIATAVLKLSGMSKEKDEPGEAAA